MSTDTDTPLVAPTSGPWTVRLVIPCGEAVSSPVEAVETFKRNVLELGLLEFVYRVEHTETGELFYVQGAYAYTEDEAIEVFGDGSDDGVSAEDEDDDDPDRP